MRIALFTTPNTPMPSSMARTISPKCRRKRTVCLPRDGFAVIVVLICLARGGKPTSPCTSCVGGEVIVVVMCSSRIRIALLLSRKRCAIHAGRRRHFSAPATGEERSHVPFLLQVSPDRQPNAVHDVLVCAKASARVLRNALPGVGYNGARPFNLHSSPRRTHHYR